MQTQTQTKRVDTRIPHNATQSRSADSYIKSQLVKNGAVEYEYGEQRFFDVVELTTVDPEDLHSVVVFENSDGVVTEAWGMDTEDYLHQIIDCEVDSIHVYALSPNRYYASDDE